MPLASRLALAGPKAGTPGQRVLADLKPRLFLTKPNRMRKTVHLLGWALLLCLAFIGLPHTADASHMLGGDITYTYLGNNGPASAPFRYRINLKAYVDGGTSSAFPNGNFAQGPLSMGFYSATTNQLITSVSVPNQITPQITRVRIPISGNCAVDPSDTAVIRFWLNPFETEINLPFSLRGYRVMFVNVARSGLIQNLSLTFGGGGNPSPQEGITYLASIPSPLTPNSSPQFFTDANVFICRGDTVTLANTARDPDGDRLIFRFVRPLDAFVRGQGITPATYPTPRTIGFDSTRGFSLAQPFGPNGYAEINSASGFTRYYSPNVGQYVVAFEVLEYRQLSSGRDTLLSSTRREVQILVRDCLPNNPPTSNNGSPGVPPTTTYNIVEGESLTFSYGASDTDSMTISAEADIIQGTGGYTGPRATFPTAVGQGEVRGTFNWQTQCGVTGTFPVIFTVIDKGCPPKTTNGVVLINVSKFQAPRTLSLGEDSVCGLPGTYTYTVASTAPDNQFLWKVTGGTVVGSPTGKTVQIRWDPVSSISTAFLRVVQTSPTGLRCKDSTTFNIRVFPLVPVAIAPSRFDLCQGDTVRLVARGGFGNFKWTNLAGGPPVALSGTTDSAVRAFPTASEQYVVSSINVAGCTVRDTIAVRWVADVARAGRDSAFCAQQTVSIGSDSVSGYNYAWTPTTGVTLPRRARTTVTLDNTLQRDSIIRFVQTATERLSGCVSTDTVQLRVRPLPIVNAGPDTATFCSSSSITLPGTSSFPARLLWTKANTATNYTLTPPTDTTATVEVRGRTNGFFDVFRGRVRLQATDRFGCVGRDSINIRINPLPQVTFSPRDSACAGTNITVGASQLSGYTYGWKIDGGLAFSDSNAAQPTINLPIALGDTATFYTAQVRIINQYGCRKDSSQRLRRNNLPRANAGADQAFCSADSVTLGAPANSRYAYAWQNTAGFGRRNVAQPRFSATNTPPGSPDRFLTVGLAVTNTRTTCANTDSVRLRIYSRPVVQAGLQDTLALCNRGSVTLGTAARPGQSYVWRQIGTRGLGSAPGYTVDTVAAQPVFTSTGGWANNVSHAFSYTFRLTAKTDSTGCAAADTVFVKINPTPFLYPVLATQAYPYVDSICSGGQGTIERIASLATPNTRFNVRWAPEQGLNLADTAGFRPGYTLSLPAPGAPSQAVRYRSLVTYQATGCADTVSVKVQVLPIPVAQAGPNLQVCSESSIQIGTPGTPGRAYAWTPRLGVTDTALAQPSFSLNNPTQRDSIRTLVFRVTDRTNRLGCTNTDTMQVTVWPLPLADAGADTAAVCSGSNITLGTGPSTNYSYAWTPATGLNDATASNPVLSLTGNSIQRLRYRVLVTNTTTQCRKADSITVRLNPLPVVALGSLRTVCAGSPASLGAFAADSARFAYAWTPRLGLSDTARPRTVFSSNTAGTYVIRLGVRELATNCQNADSLTLTVNPLPTVVTGPDTAYCADGQVQIGGPSQPGLTYAWQAPTPAVLGTAGASSTSFTLPNLTQQPIQTWVRLTTTIGATNCAATDSVRVTTWPRPENAVLASSPNVVCPGTRNQPYTINPALPGFTYTWTVGDSATLVSGQGTPTILVNYGGSRPGVPITIIATNTFGCTQRSATNFSVTINPLLRPATPAPASGLTQLCFNQARDTYGTVTSPNSTYTWRYAPAGQPSGTVIGTGNSVAVTWPTLGLAKIWVDEISAPPPPFGQCFGSSDTLLVRINISPDTNLSVTGPAALCQFTSGSFALNGLDSSTFAWTIRRLPLADSSRQAGFRLSTLTNRFDTAGNYQITAFETSNRGCPGKLRPFSLLINPKPVPTFADTSFVCPNQAQAVFRVQGGLQGSLFNWFTAAPATLVSAQGTNAVTIALNGQPLAGLRVVETSTANCPSDTLNVPFKADNSRVELLSVSTREDDDSRVLVRLRVSNNGFQASPSVLERQDAQGGFSTVANQTPLADGQIVELEDNAPASTVQSVNRYRISLNNRCNLPVTSGTHATILLTARPSDADSKANLNWTPYEGFNGLQEYQIIRRLENETSFNFLKNVGPTENRDDAQVGKDAFRQAFRIKATDAVTGEVSYSNIAEATFQNPLGFGNIITDNGDALNADFQIENLKLYPTNSFRVYNRWGRLVHQASNYQGGYKPAEPGVYLFEFTTPAGFTKKGWFEVVKE